MQAAHRSLITRDRQAFRRKTADLVGAYGISFMAASVSGAGLDVLRLRAGRGRAIAAVICVAAVIAADVVYGGVRLRESASIEPSARVIAIQTNLPQSNKIAWSPEDQARDVPEFIDLTRWAFGSSAGPCDIAASGVELPDESVAAAHTHPPQGRRRRLCGQGSGPDGRVDRRARPARPRPSEFPAVVEQASLSV